MGNSSSRSSSSGPTIVAEALEPLPRYSDICCILGGVNKREHTLLKTSLGFAGGAGGKYTVKDVKRGGEVVLKSESKSNRKRTITMINSGQGQKLLRVEGTHECVGFRKGCIITPRGIPGEDGDYIIPGAGLRGHPSQVATGLVSSASISSASSSPTGGSFYNSDSDLAFTARALDETFFEWGIDLRSNLSPNAHSNPGPVNIWAQENVGMGTVDFSWEGRCVARIASSPGGSIVWNGEKFDVGKNSIAMVIAPGMDWVLISTMCLLLLSRQSEHDVGLSTRAGDLSLLSSLLSSEDRNVTHSRSSHSISGKSSGSREAAKWKPSSTAMSNTSGSGSTASTPRKVHGHRIIEEEG